MEGELADYRAQLRAQGYAAETVHAKVNAVTLAAAHAGVPPEQLTREQVLAWLGAARRADWTRIKYLSHLSAWCAWAGLGDVTAGIHRPRTPASLPRPVPEEDLAALLAVAAGPVRSWVLLGAFCGLRAHESAKVAGTDLVHAGTDLVTGAEQRALRVLGKGGRWGVVPCPPVVLEDLGPALVLAGRGRLWPQATSATVQQAVRRLAASAGVACTSHQLRHRYGTMVYAAGQDLLATQRLMRHASPATTAGYAALASDQLAGLVGGLPGAQGPGRGLRVVAD